MSSVASYVEGLPHEVKNRYEEKTRIIGGLYPFAFFSDSGRSTLTKGNLPHIEASDIVQITYTVTGITTHEALNECIIAYASALYNNPEGLSEMDMRRINFRLRTISQ